MRNTALEIFENRFDILMFAAHTTTFNVTDIFEAVLDASRMTIRKCLSDLIESGYIEKLSVYDFQATAKTKQLFKVAL
ncbi:hypothetical protein HUN33_00435 [Acinetobacter bereziniae]|uniref:hypothetical protein n=1 Tax=Acinetobacter bereziniae TaxID=106648 RepID=UPI001580D8B6|nr:hypothetical protein [Acinetobacter bereziniae]NUF61556.1 hypothetical protein [Acinetobacter bereziniae]NUG06162.1 hypothetical protein [Acinetobacter bereziniae]NUG62317.1 hypothetical protein [Acinetobacter bereziniae]NUG69181.1 hypothetical protein [Acinetobacter bereziniae]NUG78525.1 hypothetical protein [Acinetobacter bereziniae]